MWKPSLLWQFRASQDKCTAQGVELYCCWAIFLNVTYLAQSLAGDATTPVEINCLLLPKSFLQRNRPNPGEITSAHIWLSGCLVLCAASSFPAESLTLLKHISSLCHILHIMNEAINICACHSSSTEITLCTSYNKNHFFVAIFIVTVLFIDAIPLS